MAPTASDTIDFANNIKAFYDSETLSDVTVRFGNKEIKAHKFVLCQGSEYFMASLAGNFKEASDSTITLHEDNPEAVDRLLRHLYGRRWILHRRLKDSIDIVRAQAIVALCVDAYIVGSKYMVPSFRNAAKNLLHGVLDMLTDTEEHSKAFAHLVEYVYATQSDAAADLRGLFVQHFTEQVSSVGHSFIWKTLMVDVPQFNWDVMDALMKGESTDFEGDGRGECGRQEAEDGPA